MSYRIEWGDFGYCTITPTDAPPDGQDVHATWTGAKNAALHSAIDNRDQWAHHVRTIRAMTKAEADKQ